VGVDWNGNPRDVWFSKARASNRGRGCGGGREKIRGFIPGLNERKRGRGANQVKGKIKKPFQKSRVTQVYVGDIKKAEETTRGGKGKVPRGGRRRRGPVKTAAGKSRDEHSGGRVISWARGKSKGNKKSHDKQH